ncbi:hypothetical protein BD779DRAFT_1476385 [Infundibulicybe gibba]|nr:hypothetical protein BD779DRAFT_1476385 [Infundibulicybe gibba]
MVMRMTTGTGGVAAIQDTTVRATNTGNHSDLKADLKDERVWGAQYDPTTAIAGRITETRGTVMGITTATENMTGASLGLSHTQEARLQPKAWEVGHDTRDDCGAVRGREGPTKHIHYKPPTPPPSPPPPVPSMGPTSLPYRAEGVLPRLLGARTPPEPSKIELPRVNPLRSLAALSNCTKLIGQ